MKLFENFFNQFGCISLALLHAFWEIKAKFSCKICDMMVNNVIFLLKELLGKDSTGQLCFLYVFILQSETEYWMCLIVKLLDAEIRQICR